MVKRFTIPPPITPPDGATEHRIIDMKAVSWSDLLRELKNAKLLPIYSTVCRRWLPLVRERLSSLPHHLADRADRSDEMDANDAETMCEFMAMVYVGRRIGTLDVTLAFTDGATTQTGCEDGTIVLLSQMATRLAALLGEESAAKVFSSLEAVTDGVITSMVKPGHRL